MQQNEVRVVREIVVEVIDEIDFLSGWYPPLPRKFSEGDHQLEEEPLEDSGVTLISFKEPFSRLKDSAVFLSHC